MREARYNIYTLIHKGIRSRMCSTLVALGSLDHTDTGAVIRLLDKTHDLLILCQRHLEHENAFIHPELRALQGHEQLQTDREHLHHEAEIKRLIGLVNTIKPLQEWYRRGLLYELYSRFAVFVADNLIHMHAEETDNAEVLFAHHSDDEIRAIERRLVESLSPEESYQSLLLILPAITHSERVTMLLHLREQMPFEIFSELLEDVCGLLGEYEASKINFLSQHDGKELRLSAAQ